MKKIKLYLALCAISSLLLAGCGTIPPVADPVTTEAPVATETPVPTETSSPTAITATTEAPVPTETPAPAVTAAPTEAPVPTETPAPAVTTVPTEAPVPTETPAPTVTAAPTEAPVPTETPAPAATAAPTEAPVPTATPSVTESRSVTFDFLSMSYLTSYDLDYSVQNDGSVDLLFEGQYKEIKFLLPETIDLKACEKVTVKARSEYANLTVKLYDEEILANAYCGEVFRKYDCLGNGIIEYELYPDVTPVIHGIGLMSLDNVADPSQYNATVYSITFHFSENYKPTPTPTPFVPESIDGANLLNTYGKTFGYLGTCINLNQLQNASTLALVKTQYNSVTLENEMKPDAILNSWSPSFISVEEAKKLGYVIPDNYTESTVPRLNFSTIDRVLEICEKNDLMLRAHTLVWHSQTPIWFFKTGYNSSGAYVSKEVMDARMEFYIRTVMSHVYNHKYGDVVYAWDVVNEYWNADSSNWIAIYGAKNTSPSFVKKAFEIADDVLRDFGIRDRVTLIFNDFNTYMNARNLIAIVNYINSDGIVCDGFGMQAHLDTGFPSTASFKNTVNAFLNTGLEVQITELDVTTNNASTQEKYYYELMTYLLEIKKNGGKITGITYWGLSDQNSWRGGQKPLLFSTPTNPKDVYYRVLQAYTDAGLSVEK